MAESEGVIQYDLAYRPGDLPAAFDPEPLFIAFRACRARELVGRSASRYGGYAYGNLSQRVTPGFVISGTQTGGKAALGRQDLAWVTAVDPAANQVVATGPARPSSEAMSHGEVYGASADVGAVIHVHSPGLWRAAARLGLPVTPPSAGYGTPAMAREIRRLLDAQPLTGVLAMGGHEDGIIAYARAMDGALQLLLERLEQAEGSA
jgi:hypothetical protein